MLLISISSDGKHLFTSVKNNLSATDHLIKKLRNFTPCSSIFKVSSRPWNCKKKISYKTNKKNLLSILCHIHTTLIVSAQAGPVAHRCSSNYHIDFLLGCIGWQHWQPVTCPIHVKTSPSTSLCNVPLVGNWKLVVVFKCSLG